MRHRTTAAALAALALLPGSALASFHFMQIEQVIGGHNGDVERQAIQLRMRAANQNVVTNGRVVAWDAAGENPIIVAEFDAIVPNAAAGDRVLLATAEFALENDVLADFLMTRRIPETYLDAGRLTFEAHGGLIYWSLCWGGDAYTGSTGGTPTNDDDGDFGPCVADPLPTATRQAVLFTGAATAASTTNLADYALSADPATFTNNARESADINNAVIFADGFDR